MSQAKILSIQPLTPTKVVLEIEENEKKETAEVIVFIDQMDGKMYDLNGPIEENLREAVDSWIEKKSQEVEQKMRSGMIRVSPEQLANMGIDMKNPNNKPGKLII